MRQGANIVMEIHAPSDEEGGIGDVQGKKFMWIWDKESNIITALWDTGEFIRFEHGYEGWMNLVAMGLFLGKAL